MILEANCERQRTGRGDVAIEAKAFRPKHVVRVFGQHDIRFVVRFVVVRIVVEVRVGVVIVVFAVVVVVVFAVIVFVFVPLVLLFLLLFVFALVFFFVVFLFLAVFGYWGQREKAFLQGDVSSQIERGGRVELLVAIRRRDQDVGRLQHGWIEQNCGLKRAAVEGLGENLERRFFTGERVLRPEHGRLAADGADGGVVEFVSVGDFNRSRPGRAVPA